MQVQGTESSHLSRYHPGAKLECRHVTREGGVVLVHSPHQREDHLYHCQYLSQCYLLYQQPLLELFLLHLRQYQMCVQLHLLFYQ